MPQRHTEIPWNIIITNPVLEQRVYVSVSRDLNQMPDIRSKLSVGHC